LTGIRSVPCTASKLGTGWLQRTVLAVGLVIAVTLASFALIQRNQAIYQRNLATRQRDLATRQRNLAASGEFAVESEQLDATDLAAAAQLAAAAWEIQPTAPARASMLEILAERGIATLRVDTPDLPGGIGGVNAMALTPDGSILATAGGDGTARLWDVATQLQIGAPITACGCRKL
jgi:hypothetical protein